MKNIKYLIAIAIAALVTSCEPDKVIYGGDQDSGGKSLVSFENTSYQLPIVIDATGTLDIKVFVSSLATTDRTFGLAINDTDSTIIPGSVNVPATVTIPANSYEGTVTVVGTDIAGVDTTAKTLIIDIVESDTNAAGLSTTLTVFQVCPVPPTYMTGNYQVQNLSQRFAGRPFLREGVFPVTAPDEFTRQFTTSLLVLTPAMSPNAPINLSLVCNEIIFQPVTIGLSCQAGGAPPTITYGPASNPGTYDVPSGDGLFLVTYNFDINGSCGAVTEDVTFLFTKVP